MAKPAHLLPLLAENQRLNAELRAAGLPGRREFGSILRAAANGDGKAAIWLDKRFPRWREIVMRTAVADDGNDWT